MSSVSRSKLKNKRPVNSSSNSPVSGSFHAFDAESDSPANQVVPSGRFGSIEDTDENSGTHLPGTRVEYDLVSNAESLSGGSEENREKPAAQLAAPQPRLEPIPGADDDKREKMRLKNERKHQRQKEKRAQELNDKCNGYLMSKKLEVLSEQLVAMGFSQEQATMALIRNEGKVEQSVAWLFDAGEEDRERYYDVGGGGTPKIDISAELARITEIAVKYNVMKQEVRRAVVSCEGNLEKAEEIVKAQKEEPCIVPKPEETADQKCLAINDMGQQVAAVRNNPLRVQARPHPSPNVMHQRRDERDFVCTRGQATAGSSLGDMSSKSVQVLRRTHPSNRPEWPRPQQQKTPAAPVDKGWPNGGSNQSVSLPSASPLKVSPHSSKHEPRYVPLTNELKNLQLGSRKEPAAFMQRPPQSMTVSRQAPATSSRGPYLNPIEPPKPIGVIQRPSAHTKSITPSTVNSSNPINDQGAYHQSHLQFVQPRISNCPMDSQGPVRVSNGDVLGLGGTSPPLGPASSAGLYNNGMHPNNGSSSSSLYQYTWGTDSSTKFNYNDVDWRLNRGPVAPTPVGLWSKSAHTIPQDQTTRTYELFGNSSLVNSSVVGPIGLQDGGGMPGLGSIGVFQGSGGVAGLGSTGALQVGGPAGSSLGPIGGLKDSDGVAALGDDGENGSIQEWTSPPFEERDIFRQFVFSPPR